MKTLKVMAAAMLGLCAVAMTGCQTPKVPQTAPPSLAANLEGYRLGTGDEIKIVVFDEPSLSGQRIVDGQGAVSLDLIGSLPVRSLTLKEAEAALETKLKDGYLRDPRVSIALTKGRPYYIQGEITRAGEYPFTSGLTVMNAIAAAGDFTYRAEKRKVMITAADTGVEQEVQLTPTTQVRPGDRIRIRERLF
jgi:polysaccharide export outer membrane protein